MASPDSRLVWRGRELERMADELTSDMLDRVGERTAVLVQERIESLGLLDTRFMANVTYYVTPTADSYGSLLPDGIYRSARTGKPVKREKAPRQSPRPGEALVANAAPYFGYLELRYKIMFWALEQVARETDGILREAATRHLKD